VLESEDGDCRLLVMLEVMLEFDVLKQKGEPLRILIYPDLDNHSLTSLAVPHAFHQAWSSMVNDVAHMYW
jgi:hypothetical protein